MKKHCIRCCYSCFYSGLGSLLLILLVFYSAVISAQNSDAIIEPQKLYSKLSTTSSWIILDVRSEEKYAAGHIVGAINIPIEKTFRRVEKTKKVASIPIIQELFASAGISNDSIVVLYDGGGYIDAGRMYWVLEVYGHQNVVLLNGGYPGWIKRNLPVSREARQLKPTRYVAAIQPSRLATKFQTRLAIDDKNQNVIDARSNNEYIGKSSQAIRSGHIPSAISIPWDENFVETGGVLVIKSFAELKKIYDGIDSAKKVITYCNRGKHSSFTYFILRQLGYDAAHYDGSWLEWANDPNLPVITK